MPVKGAAGGVPQVLTTWARVQLQGQRTQGSSEDSQCKVVPGCPGVPKMSLTGSRGNQIKMGIAEAIGHSLPPGAVGAEMYQLQES